MPEMSGIVSSAQPLTSCPEPAGQSRKDKVACPALNINPPHSSKSFLGDIASADGKDFRGWNAFVLSILFDAVIEEWEDRKESVRVDVQQADLERAAVEGGVEQPDLNWISVRGMIERSDLKPLLQFEVQNA